ncbi:AaceriABL021Cp [[Ashbya] aceris (nom. inval.)]|nr:AaceriABL021Cp [[Ashbya] aceris (nom. inval.)]
MDLPPSIGYSCTGGRSLRHSNKQASYTKLNGAKCENTPAEGHTMFQLELSGTLRDKLLQAAGGQAAAEVEVAAARGWVTFGSLVVLCESGVATARETQELLGSLQLRPRAPRSSSYSDEFRAQLERLRAAAAEDEYRALTGGVQQEQRSYGIGPAAREVREQLAAVANVVLTAAGVAYGVWWVARAAGLVSETSVLLALGCGLAALVADVAMYNMYHRKLDEARQRERQLREQRRVVTKLDT